MSSVLLIMLNDCAEFLQLQDQIIVTIDNK